MGYEVAHAIVISSWKDDLLQKAHVRAHAIYGARKLFLVSPIVPRAANGGGSFLVAPDGSKEGWDTSDAADECRAELIAWLDKQRYGDGSTSLDWVEVQFADDDLDTRVTADSDQNRRLMQTVATHVKGNKA